MRSASARVPRGPLWRTPRRRRWPGFLRRRRPTARPQADGGASRQPAAPPSPPRLRRCLRRPKRGRWLAQRGRWVQVAILGRRSPSAVPSGCCQPVRVATTFPSCPGGPSVFASLFQLAAWVPSTGQRPGQPLRPLVEAPEQARRQAREQAGASVLPSGCFGGWKSSSALPGSQHRPLCVCC